MNARALLEVIEWIDDRAEITLTATIPGLEVALTVTQADSAVLSTRQTARRRGGLAEPQIRLPAKRGDPWS